MTAFASRPLVIALLATVIAVAQQKPATAPDTNTRLIAEVNEDPIYSLHPDGKGPYRWDKHSRVVADLALVLCLEAKNCNTLPQSTPNGGPDNRTLVLDLSHPAQAGVGLGVVRSHELSFGVFWDQDKSKHM